MYHLTCNATGANHKPEGEKLIIRIYFMESASKRLIEIEKIQLFRAFGLNTGRRIKVA
jgi:hypothetical protein